MIEYKPVMKMNASEANFKTYYENLNSEIKAYFKIISPIFPCFLIPYIATSTMQRLKFIGYFCGMDYANKEIFNFKYNLATLDHSISTALMVWFNTFDKKQTLAALFHDSASPALRHVIDIMDGDFEKHESTEIDLEDFLSQDQELIALLKNDGLTIKDISNYKDYPLVDNKRPKMCADRLDGIFLSSLVWSRKTTIAEIAKLYENTIIKTNQDGEAEYSFIDFQTASRIYSLNKIIDNKTKSDSDQYFMQLAATMVRYLIKIGRIEKKDLWYITDIDLFNIIDEVSKQDSTLRKLQTEFTQTNVIPPVVHLGSIKNRANIDPLILTVLYSQY